MTHNLSLENEIQFERRDDPENIPVPSCEENLAEEFDNQLKIAKNIGAQLVVLKDGAVAADLCGGIADDRTQEAVTHVTRFQAFSISKSLIAGCVLKLIDQNKLELDSKVAEFWPEFGSKGKSTITIRQVLLHQAGLPWNNLFYQIHHSPDWDKIINRLSEQSPKYPPGEKTAYHALNFGYILGEVVGRIAGNPVREFLNEEFLIPLGMSDTNLKISDENQDARTRFFAGTPDQIPVAWVFNSAKLKKSVIPGASLHTTARDLAIFFQMLLNEGRYAGRELLKPETVRIATSLGFEGYDESYGRLTRWGYGFNLGGEHDLNPGYPDGMGASSSMETFGHFGQRTSVAWADKGERMVLIYLCNRLLTHIGYKSRLGSISDIARENC
jgi:CubicO group peptidase (beta-lactamase class C family)